MMKRNKTTLEFMSDIPQVLSWPYPHIINYCKNTLMFLWFIKTRFFFFFCDLMNLHELYTTDWFLKRESHKLNGRWKSSTAWETSNWLGMDIFSQTLKFVKKLVIYFSNIDWIAEKPSSEIEVLVAANPKSCGCL